MLIQRAFVPFALAITQFSASPALSYVDTKLAGLVSANHESHVKSGWNDPADIALITRAFDTWLAAVLVKDRAKAASFHEEGFRAGTGGKTLDKQQHLDVQMTVGNQEMKLVKIYATRRLGDMLMVWSDHFIRADPVPEMPHLGLMGDWGGREAAKAGFEQAEFSVWKVSGDQAQCIAFTSNRKPGTQK